MLDDFDICLEIHAKPIGKEPLNAPVYFRLTGSNANRGMKRDH
ncbi:hypothetical protein [Nostoc sp. C052]|nr:hypothetical protein [Nostoc sp. C052]